MRDIWIGIAGILLITGSFFMVVGGSFYVGRRYEAYTLKKYLPQAMDGLCLQCNQIGEETGYKKGLKTGLMTCDDVLGRIDNGGRY